MERLISEQKNQDGKITLQMNPMGKLFSDSTHIIEVKACEDPMCNCGVANIIVTKEEQVGTTSIEYNVPIDVHKEEVRSRYNKEFYSKEKAHDYLPGLLRHGLTSEDWLSLRSEYFEQKFIIGEQVNPDEISFEFEPEDYEDVTLLFPYYEAFHWASFVVELNEKKYVVFDHYCKNPACNCGDMLLDVHLVIEKEEGKVTRSIGGYFYNYDTGNSRIEGEATIASITQQIFKEHKDFNELFRRRNLVVRKLYAKAKHKYDLKQLKQLKSLPKKTGRNEVCPCGSGKKYKKCCLRGA